MPGIDSRAPERTDTSSGSSWSPSRLPVCSSRRASASATWSAIPSGSAWSARMYSTHASVVIVNPDGTRSGPSTRVISATLAPLPPSSSRMSLEPSAKSYTHFDMQRHPTGGLVTCRLRLRQPAWLGRYAEAVASAARGSSPNASASSS